MSSTESKIFSRESPRHMIECMICGSAIRLANRGGSSSHLTCDECGADFEIASRIPLSICYPGQECGE